MHYSSTSTYLRVLTISASHFLSLTCRASVTAPLHPFITVCCFHCMSQPHWEAFCLLNQHAVTLFGSLLKVHFLLAQIFSLPPLAGFYSFSLNWIVNSLQKGFLNLLKRNYFFLHWTFMLGFLITFYLYFESYILILCQLSTVGNMSTYNDCFLLIFLKFSVVHITLNMICMQ